MAGNFQAQALVKNECSKADCILLCYAINSNDSFKRLDNWLDELNADEHGQKLPIVLVGTKRDLAGEHRAVEKEQAEDYQQEIGQ